MARKMKDSGIEWIGEVPEEWDCVELKRFVCVNNGKEIAREVSPDDPLAIPVYGSGGVFKYTDQYMYDGCCVMFGRKGTLGKPMYVNGKIWAVDTMYYLTHTNRIDAKFNYYQLSAFDWESHITQTALPSVVASEIVSCKFTFPDIEEQKCIAHTLDNHTYRIDLAILQTRSSIEEYKKLKQAVITQAVTKGVRGNRPMKDSRIEWIGEIPDDWRITQLRHCATVKSGITLGKTYEKNASLYEMPYLRVANVQDGYVSTDDVATLAVTEDEIEKYRLHAGDVLMTEGGDRDKLGRGCVWDGRIDPCLHQNHIFAVHTDETFLIPYFLEYLTASKVGRCYFDVTAIKTTNLACTSSSKVLAFSIPLPGTDEQAEIVTYLKKKCSAIDTLIAKKQAVLTELENYKKSTIYEYVTGKRQV